MESLKKVTPLGWTAIAGLVLLFFWIINNRPTPVLRGPAIADGPGKIEIGAKVGLSLSVHSTSKDSDPAAQSWVVQSMEFPKGPTGFAKPHVILIHLENLGDSRLPGLRTDTVQPSKSPVWRQATVKVREGSGPFKVVKENWHELARIGQSLILERGTQQPGVAVLDAYGKKHPGLVVRQFRPFG